MPLADLSFVLTHLWQSTFCVFAASLLTLALKNNRASARYWVWLAASVKFLIPFSLLVSAGSELGSRMLPSREQPQVFSVMEEISRPLMLSNPTPMLSGSVHTFHPVLGFLFGVWLCGFVTAAIYWLMSWRRIRAALRSATPLHLNLSIPAMSFPGRLEPGVFGIRKPVLLLPEGITRYLTPDQLATIVEHELCHVRRRDNLTAAIHMVVEAIFWFYPPVWWIRTRLIQERERACDEDEQLIPEVIASLIRMTGGNFRLLTRLLTQIERVLSLNDLHLVSNAVVEAARDSLLIGTKLKPCYAK
jgi:beta-lactamase regulating signal transducer with metallopeptidase domain